MACLKFFFTFFLAYVPFSLFATAEAPTEPAAPAMPEGLPPTPIEVGSYEGAFLKMILTLGALILLVFLTIWILRRLSQGRFRGGGGHQIEILEKRPLSAKSMLYVVQVGNKQVLISESQFDVRHLATIEELAVETTE